VSAQRLVDDAEMRRLRLRGATAGDEEQRDERQNIPCAGDGAPGEWSLSGAMNPHVCGYFVLCWGLIEGDTTHNERERFRHLAAYQKAQRLSRAR
jgi:hypothetical protein